MKNMTEKTDKKNLPIICDHEIEWMNKRWLGIFPSEKRGVCLKCGKNFKLTKKEGIENVEELP